MTRIRRRAGGAATVPSGTATLRRADRLADHDGSAALQQLLQLVGGMPFTEGREPGETEPEQLALRRFVQLTGVRQVPLHGRARGQRRAGTRHHSAGRRDRQLDIDVANVAAACLEHETGAADVVVVQLGTRLGAAQVALGEVSSPRAPSTVLTSQRNDTPSRSSASPRAVFSAVEIHRSVVAAGRPGGRRSGLVPRPPTRRSSSCPGGSRDRRRDRTVRPRSPAGWPRAGRSPHTSAARNARRR